jgi:hypothetical protein
VRFSSPIVAIESSRAFVLGASAGGAFRYITRTG